MSKQTRGNSEADQRRQRPSPFLSPPRHMPNSDSIAIDLNHHHRQVEEDKKKKHDESHEDQLLPGREESEDFLDIELGEEYDIGYDYWNLNTTSPFWILFFPSFFSLGSIFLYFCVLPLLYYTTATNQ